MKTSSIGGSKVSTTATVTAAGTTTTAATASMSFSAPAQAPQAPPQQQLRTTSSDLGGNRAVARATEGWLELFLTVPEKYSFSQWKEVIEKKSFIQRNSVGLFEWAATFLPDTVAPNVVTLTGFLCLGQAWYLTSQYGADYPTACTWLAVGNILLFFITNSLALHHADRIRQHTSLSDLFKYACDNCSAVWLAMLTTYCLGGTKVETQWYAAQASQLVLLLKHLSAFKRRAGLRYRLSAGPGEVLMACMVLLAVRATIGLEGCVQLYYYVLDGVRQYLVRILPTDQDPKLMTGEEVVRTAYYILFVTALVQALALKEPHGWTRFGLTTSLLMRVVPALFIQAGIPWTVTLADAVCDGLFMAVLTSDLTLAKMASRELHPWVVLMSLATVLSHGVILTLVAIYFIGVFSDLCFYMNLPLLATCRNVYCDGVYDLCHIGHKRAFQNALALGNRLFVGVMSDEDTASYKRPPIMTHDERCAEVEACKSVTKVIPNAPCFGLTQEFLDEHQIHVVAFGEEYLEKFPDPKDDPYYGYVRQIGIAHPLPRTNTLSTTDLITRIHKATAEKKSPT